MNNRAEAYNGHEYIRLIIKNECMDYIAQYSTV